ncbi:Zn-dependent exopeptidase [Schizophyllum fasciatum]
MLFRNVFPLLGLGLAGVTAAYSQEPLGVGYDGSAHSVTSMSAAQREQLMLELWKGFDVVEIMHLTGHGDGLDEERLVHVFGEDEPRRMTEGDKLRLKQQGREFMDITEHPNLGRLNAQRPQPMVKPELSSSAFQGVGAARGLLAGEITTEHLRADIAKLSSFWNRNYRSNWGLLSSNWVFDHVSSIVAAHQSDKTRVTVTKFPHKFVQNSVVLRLEAAGDGAEEGEKELVIVGAHQDSLNYRLPFFRAPGADDDGSGTVTVFQILRSLVEQEFVPPPGIAVEFHWYAAEEGGLLGSQDVAAFYEAADVKVKGMLQMDMTAFVKEGTEPKIAFFQDKVDKNLTTFATKLVEAYVPLPWNMTTCGPTCGSDHMSWTRAGYPAIFATEGLFEDFPQTAIHTINDDIEAYDAGQDRGAYDFDHMLQFVKLGIAFVAELSVA